MRLAVCCRQLYFIHLVIASSLFLPPFSDVAGTLISLGLSFFYLLVTTTGA